MFKEKSLTDRDRESLVEDPRNNASLRSNFGMKSRDQAWVALMVFDQAMREGGFSPSKALVEALGHPLAAAAQGVARQAAPDVSRLAGARNAGDLAEDNAWRALATIEAMGFSRASAQALMAQEFMSKTLGKASLEQSSRGGEREDLQKLMDLAHWPGLSAFGSNLRLELALGPIAARSFVQEVAADFKDAHRELMDWDGLQSDAGASAGLGLWMRKALARLLRMDGGEGEVDLSLAHRARLLGDLAEQVGATLASDEARRVGEALDEARPALAWVERLVLEQATKRAAAARRGGSL
jgi:hypothetical protein